MTTNLGTRDINRGVLTGFQASGELSTDYDRMKAKVSEELKQHFRPEFLNRVDDVVVFPPLRKDEIVQIVDLMIARLDERMRDQDMAIELTPAAKDLLADKGFDPVLGARPLHRAIQREIEDVLSEKILFGEVKAGQLVQVDAGPDPKHPEDPTREIFLFKGVDREMAALTASMGKDVGEALDHGVEHAVDEAVAATTEAPATADTDSE